MFGRKKRGCRGCGPGTFTEMWITYDSLGRPHQLEAPDGPGIGPDLKAYGGPDRRADYIDNNGARFAAEGAREAPPQVLSPLPHAPAHIHIPAMTNHPYSFLPHHGAVELLFPSPIAWTDPGLWNVDPQRQDWRRPDAVLPGAIQP